jgi:ABC-type transporter Mla subunit MlaD
MSKTTNYFKIGLFTLAAFTALAAATLYFGLGAALRPTLACETNFDHSVQGLSVGGAVNFRGTRVGQISAIDIPAEPGLSGRRTVRVRFFLDPGLVTGRPGATVSEARGLLEAEITRKLRCMLSFQGVSGLGYLDLDYVGTDYDLLEGVPAPSEPGRLVVPGARGSMLAIGEAVNAILASLRTVDFGALNHAMTATLAGYQALSGTLDQEARTISANMNTALERITYSVRGLGDLTESLAKDLDQLDLRGSNEELRASLRQFKRTMGQAEEILRAPRTSLPQTLENLRVMSENLRDLSETAKRYPSQLLFGRPPSEVK